MFLGQYYHNFDSKGRVMVPSRYRETLPSVVYVTRGFEQNLNVMPPQVFEFFAKQVSGLSISDPNARRLRQLIFSNGLDVEIDSAGRILIPQIFRDTAGLGDEVVIAGMGDYFELMSKEQWELRQARLIDPEANFDRFIDFRLATS